MSKTIDYEFKRGDTFPLKKFRPTNAEGTPLTLTVADELYFTMKKTELGEALVKKTINNGITLGDDGYYHIVMETEDTRDLDAGGYVYDIELQIHSSERNLVKTIIDGQIELLQDVTNRRDY